MNTEQAFVEGFVKRASEYGFDEHQANGILKHAVRGEHVYSMVNNVPRASAKAALTKGLSNASPYMQPAAPQRGSNAASVLAGMAGKLREGARNPSPSLKLKANLSEMNSTAANMLHPNTHPRFANDLDLNTNVGKILTSLNSVYSKYPEA